MGRHLVHLLINHCFASYTLTLEACDFCAQTVAMINTQLMFFHNLSVFVGQIKYTLHSPFGPGSLKKLS